MIMHQHWHDHS